ncbi:MAG: DUF417 family protein [Myxococcaceae bacterium]
MREPERGERVDGRKPQTLRAALLRSALIAVIVSIGMAKAWPAEAQAIQPLVSNSPLLSWVYEIFSVRTFALLLGIVELTIAFLIGVRSWSPRAALVGSAGGIVMFLTTLSFLFTTPGVWDPSGPPVFSAAGGFLFKDLVLLGVAVWSFLEARDAVRVEAAGRVPLATRRPAIP